MKTKFFRVAVEGATTDGRQIEKQWLLDAAATYNRDTYAARVNMEHIRGITADKPFKAYGDVISLKTEEISIDLAGKQEKRLALFAELDVTDELVAINRDKQKLYTSIEINPNFAATGKAYLMGLAVTDSPASLGTEMLQFAAGLGEKNPLAGRKQQPGNLFSAADDPVTLELVEGVAPAADTTGLIASAKAFFDRFTTAAPAAPAPAPAAPAAPAAGAQVDAAAFAELGKVIEGMATTFGAGIKAVSDKFDALSGEVTTLKTTVEKTPAPGNFTRPPATGGAAIKTDC